MVINPLFHFWNFWIFLNSLASRGHFVRPTRSEIDSYVTKLTANIDMFCCKLTYYSKNMPKRDQMRPNEGHWDKKEAKMEAVFLLHEYMHDGYQMKACDETIAINVIWGHFRALWRSQIFKKTWRPKMEAKMEAIFLLSEHRHDGYQLKACEKEITK